MGVGPLLRPSLFGTTFLVERRGMLRGTRTEEGCLLVLRRPHLLLIRHAVPHQVSHRS